MSDTVLCLNAGSSSIKFELFAIAPREELQLVLRGQIEGIGFRPRLSAKHDGTLPLIDRTYTLQEVPDVSTAVLTLTEWLREQLKGELPRVVGHRVVFGGTRYSAPVLIDGECLRYLRTLVPFMPLHLPNELAPVELIRQRMPNLPQVAVFDTAFHRGHAELMQRLPIPEWLHREGVLSYGYHGISYEFIAGRLQEIPRWQKAEWSSPTWAAAARCAHWLAARASKPVGVFPLSTAYRWGRDPGAWTQASFSIFSRSNACPLSRSRICFIVTAASRAYRVLVTMFASLWRARILTRGWLSGFSVSVARGWWRNWPL
jgi:hypothetical protein